MMFRSLNRKLGAHFPQPDAGTLQLEKGDSLNILEKTKAHYKGYENRQQLIMDAAIRQFNEKGFHSCHNVSHRPRGRRP